MSFDERVFQSDTLRFPSITHGLPPCSHDHSKVSVKAWEVQVDFLMTEASDRESELQRLWFVMEALNAGPKRLAEEMLTIHDQLGSSRDLLRTGVTERVLRTAVSVGYIEEGVVRLVHTMQGGLLSGFRLSAFDAASRMGAAGVIALERAAAHGDRYAYSALGKSNAPNEAFQALLRLLDISRQKAGKYSNGGSIRSSHMSGVVSGLARVGVPNSRVMPILQECASDPDTDIQRAAEEAISMREGTPELSPMAALQLPAELSPGEVGKLTVYIYDGLAAPAFLSFLEETNRREGRRTTVNVPLQRLYTKGSRIGVRPLSDHLLFRPGFAEQTFEQGSIGLDFYITGDSRNTGEVTGAISISIDGTETDSLSLSLRILSRYDLPPGYVRGIETVRGLRQRVFVSYSRRDVSMVKRCEQLLSPFGVKFVWDARDFESGTPLSTTIRKSIFDSDCFYLFWSENAAQSDYVRQEYLYALELGRPGFVQPYYWGDVCPERPAEFGDMVFTPLSIL
ncbi:MAG: toll/interleukin-1 receptor domain-containing protein [Nitrospira sp.]